jgi:hypothetical protein
MKKLILFLVIYLSLIISDYSISSFVQLDNTVNISTWQNVMQPVTSGNHLLNSPKLVIDTIALKYFPLAVGNVYKYYYTSSSFYNYYYKVRIVKDTIINSKKYFIANRLFPGYIGQILRCDSTSGNIYNRSPVGFCSYSPYEELIDSLRAKKGDTTLVCTAYIPRHYCTDTGYTSLFGNLVKKKSFTRNTTETSTSVTYGTNFGIINSFYSDFYGMASESLVGCYINGILYGDTTLTETVKLSTEIPSSYSLFQNYPNPFNPSTIIRFQIKDSRFVSLKVYDIPGKEVAVLVNEKLNPGTYEIPFSINHLPRQANNQTPSGIYFYRLTADGFSETKKMVLMK